MGRAAFAMILALQERRIRERRRLALRFMGVSLAMYAVVGGLAWLAVAAMPSRARPRDVVFPVVFVPTTLLLAGGSYCLHAALTRVRQERQRAFRRYLRAALALGALFVVLQAGGLVLMAKSQDPAMVSTGVNSFLTMFAALHALHFVLALWFLIWVNVNAAADQYDHEYHFGVAACGWFWHVLGLVWFVVLGVYLIVWQAAQATTARPTG
jgi:heme/copper-type cytochrome/quinol oxidase subunit 3